MQRLCLEDYIHFLCAKKALTMIHEHYVVYVNQSQPKEDEAKNRKKNSSSLKQAKPTEILQNARDVEEVLHIRKVLQLLQHQSTPSREIPHYVYRCMISLEKRILFQSIFAQLLAQRKDLQLSMEQYMALATSARELSALREEHAPSDTKMKQVYETLFEQHVRLCNEFVDVLAVKCMANRELFAASYVRMLSHNSAVLNIRGKNFIHLLQCCGKIPSKRSNSAKSVRFSSNMLQTQHWLHRRIALV